MLIGQAILEYRLLEVLALRFRTGSSASKKVIRLVLNPDDPRSLLYSGWARAIIGHVIGLYDEEFFQILSAIRELRNDFAHTPATVVLDKEKVQKITCLFQSARRKKRLKALSGAAEWFQLVGAQTPFSDARLSYMAAVYSAEVELNELEKKLRWPELQSEEFEMLSQIHKPSSQSLGPSSENE